MIARLAAHSCTAGAMLVAVEKPCAHCASIAELRSWNSRANTPSTRTAACGANDIPMTAMSTANPTAAIARPRKNRRWPRMHTIPNEAATSTPQERARSAYASLPGVAGMASSSPASATHASISVSDPPFHHPATKQAAIAGTSNSMVFTTGAAARTTGACESRRNAASASTIRVHPSSRGGAARASLISGLVPPNVRHERQVARPFDRRRQLTLMAGTDAAQPTRQDLAGVGEKATEGAIILVIDEPHAGLAEWATLLWS